MSILPAVPSYNPRDIRPFITGSLRERILAKLDPQPNGCIYWTGAYNTDGRKTGRRFVPRRPVIYLGGGKRGAIVYVGPLLLAMNGEGDLQPHDPVSGERLYACHTCPTTGDGWYRCVNLAHLQWGTQVRNEQDKKQVERLPQHGQSDHT